jgi:hypothetical protein
MEEAHQEGMFGNKHFTIALPVKDFQEKRLSSISLGKKVLLL